MYGACWKIEMESFAITTRVLSAEEDTAGKNSSHNVHHVYLLRTTSARPKQERSCMWHAISEDGQITQLGFPATIPSAAHGKGTRNSAALEYPFTFISHLLHHLVQQPSFQPPATTLLLAPQVTMPTQESHRHSRHD